MQLLQKVCHNLNRVRALKIDARAGVAALEAMNADGNRIAKDAFGLKVAAQRNGLAACRVDGALALTAAVHADHAPGLELAVVERLRAEHADFLLHRKDRFQRRVLQIRFRQQAKNRRDAGSVVRAERRAVGSDDVILQNQLQRVFFKIVLNLRQLDANHVDVRL